MAANAKGLQARRTLTATIMIGIGLMAAVDEIAFHQLLAWHHFYDRSTSAIALMSDGLLHSAELIVLVAGFFMFADLRYRNALSPRHATAGILLGAGGFQIFDGIVDHKILRIHQIRYGVEDLWLYDTLWNLFGLVLLVAGIIVLRRAPSPALTTG